jgi:hypothetical protein
MSRLVNRLVMCGVCLLLLAPSMTSTASPASTANTAYAKAFMEGFYVISRESHHNSLTIEINAVKRVDGNWRQSEVHISYHYAYVDGTRDFDATVLVPGDPDLLEVSKDLGWGGLDTTIQVQWRRVDCVFGPNRTCGPAVLETVPVELHVYLWANEPYRQEGGLFKRNANLSPSNQYPTGGVKGTINTPHHLTRFESWFGMHSSGYNFSDQFPG